MRNRSKSYFDISFDPGVWDHDRISIQTYFDSDILLIRFSSSDEGKEDWRLVSPFVFSIEASAITEWCYDDIWTYDRTIDVVNHTRSCNENMKRRIIIGTYTRNLSFRLQDIWIELLRLGLVACSAVSNCNRNRHRLVQIQSHLQFLLPQNPFASDLNWHRTSSETHQCWCTFKRPD